MDGASTLLAWDGGLTLLPPLVAIGLALLTRQVVVSLGFGVLFAAVVAHEGVLFGDAGVACLVPSFVGAEGVVPSFLGVTGAPEPDGAVCGVLSYVGSAVLDPDNFTIAFFTVMVAAMVGIMGASGATRTLVGAVERLAQGPRGAMVASWLSGFVVFFDDYANCLVVGGSMGPVCDRYGVSRTKLAYIVDSTAAPVASLAIVGTWVGYEVGLLDQALVAAGQAEGGGFELFLQALPYRFYGIFALALVGILAFTGRDFGPMLDVEREARRAHAERTATEAPEVSWARVAFAAMPVVLLVLVTFVRMMQTGWHALGDSAATAPLYDVLGNADAYRSMLWGGTAGVLAATLDGLVSRSLAPTSWLRAATGGAVAVLQALVVLYLAWSLGNAIGDTAARDFLLGALGDWFPPALLPAVVFVLAGFIAFSTGTSFGTMSILIPLAVPLAVGMASGAVGIIAGTTAAVLAGSCLGDHASPISDTTVLSAAGSQADLVEHVRTQLPYALLAGVVSVVVGYLPAGLGLSPWLAIPVGLAVLYGVVRMVGEVPEAAAP